MKRVCAWCLKYLGKVDAPGIDPNDITHGMCDDCTEIFQGGTTPLATDFFAGVGIPALVIQDNLHIRCANQLACEVLHKSPNHIIGMYAGDAINCIHARQAGGCGKTMFCDHCTIRRSMLKTLITSESCKAIAYPDIQWNHHSQTMRLSISTQKIRDCILLCIDDAHLVTN